ncbi:MAG: PqqD family protein [Clostridia bacterium]|nr:PqqD family protein [Clostridia bacterium]MBR2473100.1 PqqD family protein [Clostridia bacterium]MBR3866016.1 PqqD family protein [Clostridia bacterium]
MKLKDGFILRTVADTHIVVAVGKNSESFNKMIKLNDSAAFLWRRLSCDITAEDLANELVAEYGISMDVALSDVESFVSVLKAADLLV